MATLSQSLTTASSPRANSKGKEEEPAEDYEARPYQLELLDAAIEQNTIVNLGTGAGKTFIAVMLIKELSYQILKPFDEPDAKRSVFLVTTVPLVKQQAEYVRIHTGLDVGEYRGSDGVDSWLKPRWNSEFHKHQVLVMTMTIFKNLLLAAYLTLGKVNLLVFDECHHAVKNHDYVQIMRMFKEHIKEDDAEIPRVLGLTASLIPSKCKPGDLTSKIEELEAILCSRSQTAGDLETVAKYATNPSEFVLQYESSSNVPHVAMLKSVLEEPVVFLDFIKKDQRKYSKIYEMVKLYLEDCLHILFNLGLWCAHDFAVTGLKCIEEEKQGFEDLYDSEWEKSLLHLGSTHLEIFVKKSEEILSQPEFERHIPLTPKVKKLLLHLGDLAISSGELDTNGSPKFSSKKAPNKLLGIVFVERRTTAVTLSKLLREKSKQDPDLRHIRCAHIVGHNEGKGGTFLRKDAQMKVKSQNKVLDKFRHEKLNLLISTSVLEEGLDVPRCNTVIRFDFPPNFRSYIQSKGRARAKISTYLIFIDMEEAARCLKDLRDYRALEKELQIICHDRRVPGEEEILKRMEEFVEPYMPFGRNGPQALLSSSLSLLHKYCQKLPKDRYTISSPEFQQNKQPLTNVKDDCFIETEQEHVYQSTVTFPKNCPIKDAIQGMWMPTRRIADKSAALEAVKKLHEVGELNDHLLPVAKSEDSDDEDELKVEERKKKNVGTERRSNYYQNKVAPALTDCFPVAGPGNHLYVFLVREVGSNKIYQSLPDDCAHIALGILTRKPLPHLKIPDFSLYDEDKELHVKVVKYHNFLADLSESELEELKQCHRILFTEVLRIRGTWLDAGFEQSEKNYLVVPLRILPDFDPLEAYIDQSLAQQVLDVERKPRISSWPCSIEQYQNGLVELLHLKTEKEQRLFVVKRVDKSLTPQSPFPDSKAAPTYSQYFATKYDFPLTDLTQPALECKPLGLKERRIRLLTSRFKKTDGGDMTKSEQRGRVIVYFPQLCKLHPLPANFWKLVQCLPSILWRLECGLVADSLRFQIANETEIGKLGERAEITTSTNLRGYEDYGFGDLATQKFSTNLRTGEEEVHSVDVPDFSKLPLRGPDNAIVLQALTPKGACDSINLERLEILGDSFLKLATSVFLYCDRPFAHEGKLTCARTNRVGNFNLFLLATKHRNITEAIFSATFEPRHMWIPPCFSFNDNDPHLTLLAQDAASLEQPDIQSDQQRHYLYHKLTDKGVADCVESLIGAYLVAGGIEAALKFMKWMGIKITPPKAKEHTGDSMSSNESGEITSSGSSSSMLPTTKRLKVANVPLFVQKSSTIFSENFEAPQTTCKRVEVDRHLKASCGAHGIEKRINRVFKDRSLLLEALTHASYTKNKATDCFQRLEFLGDAVLDYLVTCHIYSTFPRYDPGHISEMRSALVNNITFAELSVQLGLHTALLHYSPSLFKHIDEYLRTVERVSSQQDGDDEGVVTESSDILCRDKNEDSTTSDLMDTAAAPSPSPSASAAGFENEDSDEEVVEIDPPKVLGDILESLAGAIFLDSGMDLESVWEVFQPLFDQKIKSFEGKIPVSPIQELYQMEPENTDVKVKSTPKPGGRNFRCTITLLDKDIKVSAKANTAKGAKNAAAKALLSKLKRS